MYLWNWTISTFFSFLSELRIFWCDHTCTSSGCNWVDFKPAHMFSGACSISSSLTFCSIAYPLYYIIISLSFSLSGGIGGVIVDIRKSPHYIINVLSSLLLLVNATTYIHLYACMYEFHKLHLLNYRLSSSSSQLIN